MVKFTQKQLRCIGNADALYERVRRWQEEHNTSGMPTAHDINVERIGYAHRYYGCNGSLFRDLTTGELFGIGRRDNTIYIY